MANGCFHEVDIIKGKLVALDFVCCHLRDANFVKQYCDIASSILVIVLIIDKYNEYNHALRNRAIVRHLFGDD